MRAIAWRRSAESVTSVGFFAVGITNIIFGCFCAQTRSKSSGSMPSSSPDTSAVRRPISPALREICE